MIPEEHLVTLGTLRFGIRMPSNCDSRSVSTSGSNDQCCCPGSCPRPSRLPLCKYKNLIDNRHSIGENERKERGRGFSHSLWEILLLLFSSLLALNVYTYIRANILT